MQRTQLRYVIKFVADMDKAVKFHRDVLGLKVKFESPGWSEFVTGDTTLALHPASDKNPAGKVELGFTVPDVEAFYREMSASSHDVGRKQIVRGQPESACQVADASSESQSCDARGRDQPTRCR